MKNRALPHGVSSLAITHPELADEWDCEKNEGLHPSDISAGSGKRVWWICRRGHSWRTAVYHRKEGHGCPCCAAFDRAVHPGNNDLKTLEPELAEEWDDEKNPLLSPSGITRYSQTKVWWKCKKGHSWKASVSKRTQGQGCPYCTGQKVLAGFNDLAAVRPDLAAEWNYERNGNLIPQDFTAGSECRVWWRCGQGHEWLAVIYSRKAGSGCPYCAGNAVLSGYNDLPTKIPELIREWDFEKNKTTTPEMVAPNSNCKVWWKCGRNHSWQAVVSSRASGKGCPYCAGRKVMAGFNDLATINPLLAAEWDSERNSTLAPDEVTASSHRRIWWTDSLGHSWKAEIAGRNQGGGCPYCAGKQVLPGFNDLTTRNPVLAKEWDYQKNGDLTPEMVAVQSHRYAWWICPEGHGWKSTISNRNRSGCPYCANRRVLVGFNDLKTIAPELSMEWNYDRNKGLEPENVTCSTRKKVWWKCDRNHSWRCEVYSRHRGSGCPVCAMKKDHHPVAAGMNDLLTVSPVLAAEWDYERNAPLIPAHVLPYSTKKVWWKCNAGHHWRARIQARQKGTGCPYCSGHITPRSRVVT